MTKKKDGYGSDLIELERAAEFIAPDGGGMATNLATIASAYRTMVQSVADYQNAVPVPTWPPYVVAVGASMIGAGSTIAAINRPSDLITGWYVVGLYAVGIVLIGWALAELRKGDLVRRRAYFIGRGLFNKWAGSVNQPHESVGALPTQRGIDNDLREVGRLLKTTGGAKATGGRADDVKEDMVAETLP